MSKEKVKNTEECRTMVKKNTKENGIFIQTGNFFNRNL
jgi:hypothetical protein